MDEPAIAARFPKVLELEPGVYTWCRCGRSATQPFCDGSHRGTEWSPLDFEIETRRTVALCQCKRTNGPPFCDGTHKTV